MNLSQMLDGRIQYVIPRFQRDYTWDVSKTENKNQIPTLWDDIMYTCENKITHFTGSIVIMNHPAWKAGYPCYTLIDGQQRIVTLSILLRALDEFLEDDNRKTMIHDYLFNSTSNDFGNLKINMSDNDKTIYKKLIEGDGRQKKNETRIGKCYHYFISQLDNIKKNPENYNFTFNELFDTTISSIEVVRIWVDDEDPCVIFESLNNKGVDLTRIDLLRNYILMKFPTSDIDGEDLQKKFYDDNWIPFEHLFEMETKEKSEALLDDYIRTYLMTSEGRVPIKGTYIASRKKIDQLINGTDKTDKEIKRVISELLDSLVSQSTAYKYILCQEVFNLSNNKNNIMINNSLKCIHETDRTSQRCYLLMLFDEYLKSLNETDICKKTITENDFISILKIIESFLVRRSIVSNSKDNTVDVMFLSACKERIITPSKMFITLDSMNSPGQWPNDESVIKSIEKENMYNPTGRNKTCLMILRRIDASYNNKEIVTSEDDSIEHIFPQTPSEWWMENSNHNIKNMEKNIHLLGNLTITGHNQELSNLPYPEKLEKYRESNHPMTRNIFENNNYSEWHESQLALRNKELSNIIIKIWPRNSKEFGLKP